MMTLDTDFINARLDQKSRAGLIEIVQAVNINPVFKSVLTMNISRLGDDAVQNICVKGKEAIALYTAGDSEGLKVFAIENNIPVDMLTRMMADG